MRFAGKAPGSRTEREAYWAQGGVVSSFGADRFSGLAATLRLSYAAPCPLGHVVVGSDPHDSGVPRSAWLGGDGVAERGM